MRTHVDLFSGIGGFALAASWAGVETIAFAEIEPYASRVLERHFSGVRNYGDVRSVPELSAWLLTGGVPCQPSSVAGKRKGAEDDRWLWPEALAAVERIRPAWVLFENPTGILSLNDGLEFESICSALESQGYEVQPIVIPASAVGAQHRRNRVWILAHTKNHGWQRGGETRSGRNGSTNHSQDVSFALNNGSHRAASYEAKQGSDRTNYWIPIGSDTWTVEPNVGRVANGIPKRVDRLRCLGNAIVPQVAYQLIKRMIEAEEKST